MKLIWFSHFVPYPPKGGNLQRSYNLIRQAAKSYEVTLVALNFLAEPAERLESHTRELKKTCERVEIRELPFRWKGGRWFAKALASPLRRNPFSCRALYSRELRSEWELILRESPEALVHIDSIDLALYVPSANSFRKVLNHHNCESAMAFRRAKRESNQLNKIFLSLQARALERMERSICATFDTNLVVSEQDAGLLQAIQPAAKFHVVENGVDTTYFKPSPPEEQRNTLVFTGMLDWYPNVSGIRFFVREVWPHIKTRFPDARLQLAGKNPVSEVLACAKADSSIVVTANPDDMRPVIARASVVICPLLEGGGTRLKILDAMATGKPVVSTTIGCEGLRVRQGENILIADGLSEFGEAVMQLLQDEKLRNQLGTEARKLVEREYCWDKIGEQLRHAYRVALEGQTRDPRYAALLE